MSKLLVSAVMMASFAVFAAEPAVPVQADVVFASTQAGTIDPSLVKMRDQMAAQKKYLTLKKLDSKKLELTQNKAEAMPLPGGKNAEFSLQSIEKNVAKVKVKTPAVETVHTLAKDKSLYLPAGAQDGGDLWLVVSQPK